MHEVRHFHAVRAFAEVVLMMPKAIRAEALFIHKKMRRVDVRDLRDPIECNPAPRPNLIGDDHAGIHFFGQIGSNSEIQPRGRNLGEIVRVGKKIPRARQGNGQVLLRSKMIEMQAAPFVLANYQLAIIH